MKISTTAKATPEQRDQQAQLLALELQPGEGDGEASTSRAQSSAQGSISTSTWRLVRPRRRGAVVEADLHLDHAGVGLRRRIRRRARPSCRPCSPIRSTVPVSGSRQRGARDRRSLLRSRTRPMSVSYTSATAYISSVFPSSTMPSGPTRSPARAWTSITYARAGSAHVRPLEQGAGAVRVRARHLDLELPLVSKRIGDDLAAVEPKTPLEIRLGVGQLCLHALEGGLAYRERVEPRQHLAGLHPIPLADEELRDDDGGVRGTGQADQAISWLQPAEGHDGLGAPRGRGRDLGGGAPAGSVAADHTLRAAHAPAPRTATAPTPSNALLGRTPSAPRVIAPASPFYTRRRRRWPENPGRLRHPTESFSSAYPIGSADHHAASSEGIACGIGARAPAAGVGEGSPFEPPHFDLSPTPAAGWVVRANAFAASEVRFSCFDPRGSHGLEIAACRRHGGAVVGRGEGSK